MNDMASIPRCQHFLFCGAETGYPSCGNICFPNRDSGTGAGGGSAGKKSLVGSGAVVIACCAQQGWRAQRSGSTFRGVQEDGPRDRRRESTGFAVRRKVRAPQGRMPGNARAPRGDGKCRREQTADGLGNGAQARVKGCGKSAPGPLVTGVARQTPSGARPNRGQWGRLSRSSPG